MSDQNDSTQESTSEGMNPDDLAALRKAAERGRQLEKENAFLRHGINTESGVGKMFFESYKGDLDGDSLKAAADEYGIADQLFASAEPEQPRQEQPVQTTGDQPPIDDPRQAIVQGGFSVADEGGPDPASAEAGWREFNDLRQQGVSYDEAMNSVIGRAFARAQQENR